MMNAAAHEDMIETPGGERHACRIALQKDMAGLGVPGTRHRQHRLRDVEADTLSHPVPQQGQGLSGAATDFGDLAEFAGSDGGDQCRIEEVVIGFDGRVVAAFVIGRLHPLVVRPLYSPVVRNHRVGEERYPLGRSLIGRATVAGLQTVAVASQGRPGRGTPQARQRLVDRLEFELEDHDFFRSLSTCPTAELQCAGRANLYFTRKVTRRHRGNGARRGTVGVSPWKASM